MAVTIFLFSNQTSEDSNNLSYQIDIKIYNWIKSMAKETNTTSAVALTDNAVKAENKIANETKNEVVKTTSSKTKSTKNSKYPTKDKLFKDIDYAVRKTAHVTLYCLFAIFITLFVKTFKIKNWKAVLIVLLIGFLYACLDEYNQKLGGTRTGKFKDSLIDTGGCLIGTTLVVAIQAMIYRNKNKEKGQS